MGALAILLRQAGHDVRGSDVALYPPMSTQLRDTGVEVLEGFQASNLDWGPERVVVGNVCRKDHPEVLAARARGIELESFPSMLEKLVLPGRRAMVVAGTHGKTTTASLVAWLLRVAGKDPSYLIGGVPQNLPRGAEMAGGDSIVLEGDEYDTAFFDKKSKFLHYHPCRAILTSVEYDHADIFDSLEQVRDAFREFVELIPAKGELIVHRDDPEALGIAARASCKVTTYRVLPEQDHDVHSADYVCRVESGRGARRTVFQVFERGELLGDFSTMLVGRYNLANLVAAIALCRSEGVDAESLRSGVARFRGVKRRQELLGVAQGVRIIEDFAHHPTAVRLTVVALRRRYPDNALHVCFEPRSSSSRRDIFFEGYASAFDAASLVYVAPVHAPEEVPAGRCMDTKKLASAMQLRGVEGRSFESIESLAESVLSAAAPGDTVVLLSSGSFGGLAQTLLSRFGNAVVFATPDDLMAIHRIMGNYGMAELHEPDEVESLVIREGDDVIACVHLQVLGNGQSFLFGLAVAQERRSEGLGWVLADSVLRRALTLGARAVTLIAGESAQFFQGKLGFKAIALDDVDPAVRELPNFKASSESGMQCMHFDLPSGEK